jgi:NAD(P)-dependent dehydrogenase (short-subunit alcohol dehydrogenase family)
VKEARSIAKLVTNSVSADFHQVDVADLRRQLRHMALTQVTDALTRVMDPESPADANLATLGQIADIVFTSSKASEAQKRDFQLLVYSTLRSLLVQLTLTAADMRGDVMSFVVRVGLTLLRGTISGTYPDLMRLPVHLAQRVKALKDKFGSDSDAARGASQIARFYRL